MNIIHIPYFRNANLMCLYCFQTESQFGPSKWMITEKLHLLHLIFYTTNFDNSASIFVIADILVMLVELTALIEVVNDLKSMLKSLFAV